MAEESEFLRRVLPEGLSKRYFSEELKRCAALRSAPDRASTSASTILTPSDPCQRRRKECGKWDAH